MLIVNTVSAGSVSYFADGRDAGTWTSAAQRLFGLSGPVDPAALRALLRGRHPSSGILLPSVRRPRRRPGWDLVFAAPKSISLLAATSSRSDDVIVAHATAVSQTLAYLESRLTVSRSGTPSGVAPAGGLIGACFHHVSNAAAEPHLHSHVVIANLTRTERGWSAVRNEDWFVRRKSVAALYQMALRAQLRSFGWDLDWRLRRDGLADIAEVPTAAIRATSAQGRLAVAGGRYQARQQAVPRPWREKAEQAGWAGRAGPEAGGADQRDPIAAPTPGQAPTGGNRRADHRLPTDPRLHARVVATLATRRSDFSAADVIVALASSHAPGAAPEQAAAWVDEFCSTCIPVESPTSGRRWSTTLARAADDRLYGALLTMARPGASVGAARRSDRPPGGDSVGRSGVVVLGAPAGRSALLAQAEQIHRWAHIWSAEGVHSSVDCLSVTASARWAALSGLTAPRRGEQVDVLVVDQADRRSTPDLIRLAGVAARSRGVLVLVEGGTMPRLTNFASHGLMKFAEEVGRVHCPAVPAWSDGLPGQHRRSPSRPAGREAAEALLHTWADRGRDALLVGLGLEEVQALNLAARRLSGVGAAGPDTRTGTGAAVSFSAGDRVVVIRSREGLPPYGTFGDVIATGLSGRSVSIRWSGRAQPSTHSDASLTGVRHGWAVTTHMAVRLGRPVLLLGSPDSVPRLKGLVLDGMGPAERGRSILLER